MLNPYRKFFEEAAGSPISRPLDLSEVFPRNPTFRNYMIVISGRCGSTWLGRMLEDLRLIGAPSEWFNTQGLPALYSKRGAMGLADYVRKTADLHPVFGMQINPERLFYLEDIIDFRRTFSEFSMIDLRRRDFVGQAFSFARARKSGQWHDVKGPPVDVSDRNVWKMIHYIVKNEQRIDRWYADQRLSPLRLVHEDIVANRHAVIARILSLLSRNNNPPDFASPPQRQMRNGDGSRDDALLSFLGRYSERIARIYAERPTIDTSAFLVED